MFSVFDIDKLESLLRDFYQLSHIRITLFDADLEELVSYPQQRAAFCDLIRKTPQGASACRRCDKEGCAHAAVSQDTYVYRCHAGLTEAVTPLYTGDVLIGYLLFGHLFAYSSFEEGWNCIRDACVGYGVDLTELEAFCRTAKLVDENTIKAASRILRAVASYLVLERMVSLQEESIHAKLDQYLSSHFTEKLDILKLCSLLGVGRSQLYKISRQLYGGGLLQHIKKLRFEKAKQLLVNHPEMSIGEIAAACGFDDYNYFISSFSKAVGTSPRVYRQLERKSMD